MAIIADGLLIAGSLAAAFYCWILSVRVKRLTDMDSGVGAAIATLSLQVDEMQRALQSTRSGANESLGALEDRIETAKETADELGKMLKTSRPKSAQRDIQSQRSLARKRDISGSTDAKDAASERPTVQRDPDDAAAKVKQLRAAQKTSAQQLQDEDSAETGDEALTAARKLQKDIRERVAGRGVNRERDDFVKALQTVLAAANR